MLGVGMGGGAGSQKEFVKVKNKVHGVERLNFKYLNLTMRFKNF